MSNQIDKAVKLLLQIRAARAALKSRYEEEDTPLKERETKIKLALLKKATELGVESFKTESGTAYKTEVVYATGSDWGMFYDWVIKNEALDAFERRLKITFIKDYLKEHGTPPPGISVTREYEIKVRRS